MSLRRALEALSDDRETVSSAREVVAFLQEHSTEAVSPQRISRATGVTPAKVEELLRVFQHTLVVDFIGDSEEHVYRLSPSPVLALEIRRFVRSNATGDTRLQRGADRFRSRYGSDR